MATINDLKINPALVCSIIVKAREFHAKEQVTFSEEARGASYEYDWAQVLADHIDDPTYIELKNVINAIRPDQQLDLVALMHLGRRDFVTFEDAKDGVSDNFPTNVTDFLLSQPLLASYLEDALHELGYSCEK